MPQPGAIDRRFYLEDLRNESSNHQFLTSANGYSNVLLPWSSTTAQKSLPANAPVTARA